MAEHRAQSAKPANNVFPGRKPDVAWLIRDRTTALNEHIMALDHQVRELEMTDRTHRQRMADLWSRIDALEQRAREQAADLAETREALKAAQKRLREMDEDSHGERG